MRYHIDTIPVWDAMKKGGECPFCALRDKVENEDVDRFLGGSVMEPDTRIRVNALGFCPKHHLMLYARQNRLGHALMTHTHMKETTEKTDKILREAEKAAKTGAEASVMTRAMKKDGGKEAFLAAADALDKISRGCILCDSVEENMNRYAYTFLHLYQNDSEFRRAFRQSKGLCLPDCALLLRMAADSMNAAARADFAKDLTALTHENMHRVADELEWFTLKFDYRNADKPWNNSRDSIERAVLRLRGDTFGTETEKEK